VATNASEHHRQALWEFCLPSRKREEKFWKKKSLVYSSSLTLTHYMIFEQVSSFAKWE
jgi:hypothetical protein